MVIRECESCRTKSNQVETLTLCNRCFQLFNAKMEVLLLENQMFKQVFRKLFEKPKKEEENEEGQSGEV